MFGTILTVSWTVWFPMVLSILTLLGFGTLMSIFWKDLINKRKENSAEKKAKEKQEHIKDIRGLMSEGLEPLEKRLDNITNELSTISKGTQAGLRNQILNAYYDCQRKGYRTGDDSENFRKMYEAYHDLHGNSFIDADVYKWFQEIPSEEEYQNIERR